LQQDHHQPAYKNSKDIFFLKLGKSGIKWLKLLNIYDFLVCFSQLLTGLVFSPEEETRLLSKFCGGLCSLIKDKVHDQSIQCYNWLNERCRILYFNKISLPLLTLISILSSFTCVIVYICIHIGLREQFCNLSLNMQYILYLQLIKKKDKFLLHISVFSHKILSL